MLQAIKTHGKEQEELWRKCTRINDGENYWKVVNEWYKIKNHLELFFYTFILFEL